MQNKLQRKHKAIEGRRKTLVGAEVLSLDEDPDRRSTPIKTLVVCSSAKLCGKKHMIQLQCTASVSAASAASWFFETSEMLSERADPSQSTTTELLPLVITYLGSHRWDCCVGPCRKMHPLTPRMAQFGCIKAEYSVNLGIKTASGVMELLRVGTLTRLVRQISCPHIARKLFNACFLSFCWCTFSLPLLLTILFWGQWVEALGLLKVN